MIGHTSAATSASRRVVVMLYYLRICGRARFYLMHQLLHGCQSECMRHSLASSMPEIVWSLVTSLAITCLKLASSFASDFVEGRGAMQLHEPNNNISVQRIPPSVIYPIRTVSRPVSSPLDIEADSSRLWPLHVALLLSSPPRTTMT